MARLRRKLEQKAVKMPEYAQLIIQIYREVNELRSSPADYVYKLELMLTRYRFGNTYHRVREVPVVTKEGVAALNDAIEALVMTEPMGELDLSEGLESAAQAHANDTGSASIIGHIGSDDTDFLQRLQRTGIWGGSAVELLDYGSVTAEEIVCAFLIDDGQPTRPHRKALLDPKYTKIGVGLAPHEEYSTVCVMALASEFTDHTNFEEVRVPEGSPAEYWELEEWKAGAVRMTCEVTTDPSEGNKARKVTKTWEMADGTKQVTQEVKNS